METVYLEQGDRRIACHVWENRKATRTLLCVHGLTRNGRDFDFLAEKLQPYYRILCPDIAGRGKSDWLKDPTGYAYPTYVMDMMKLIERYAIKTPVDWIGTSMGGLTGMFLAAANPTLIRKLVINDIGAVLPKAALDRLADYVGKNIAFKSRKEVVEYCKQVYAPWGVQDEEQWRHIATHGFTVKNDMYVPAYDPAIRAAFVTQEGKPLVEKDIELWEVWEKVACPVLLLRGEKSDLLPREVAEKMTKTGPKTTLLTIPGVGHAPALMDDGQIDLIKNWLLS